MREVIVEGIHEVSTQGKLMRASHETDVVVELIRVSLVAVVIHGAAVAEGKAAHDRQHTCTCFRVRAIDLDAHVAVRKKFGTNPVSSGSVICKPERLDGVWSDQQSVSNRQRLIEIVRTICAGVQNVVRSERVEWVWNLDRRNEIPSKQGLLRRQLVIDAPHSLIGIVLRPVAEGDKAARIVAFGKLGCNIQRCFTVQGPIDSIIGEGCAKRYDPSRIACRRGESRPVSGEDRRRRHERLTVCRILADGRTLKSTEEKHLVLHDGSAYGPAKLVALQRAGFYREIVARIEQVVPDELEQITMELIRSGFRHTAHGGRRAMLSIDPAGLDLEFL